ncbi:MAG: hypothetical protein OC190_14870 [Novosphingobium aromaticivorans]|nr:hypothetical protein [Novosphingobium aromaticivorans]
MILQTCQNCWFNPLQYETAGLPFGFCTRHRKVLNHAEQTTCGQHVRKDLGLSRATEVAAIHAGQFEETRIVRLRTGDEVLGDVSGATRDIARLREDEVAAAAMSYGALESKMATLAQFKKSNSARSAIALTSLGRGYVRNCRSRGGPWTAGLHLFWWTKKRIAHLPVLKPSDINFSAATTLSRQHGLTIWSIIMLKLTLLEDIIAHAASEDDQLGVAGELTLLAVEAVPDPNPTKLRNWIRWELLPIINELLDKDRYYDLSGELHREYDEEWGEDQIQAD